ncbi:MAG: isoprenylcysteine carboxylmethyltransferase family protein [Anaerolineales bacterium]|nr:isoprenylcysteine carboxylmethyltransferase family protein [Anaerolineales bacterium]
MSKESSLKPILTATLRLVIGMPVIGLLFFWPAGTFNYWQAWLWLAILFLPLMGMFLYLIKRDPALLERRVRTGETRPEQRRIIALSSLYLIFIFLVPGFDKRFGWSSVPVWLILLADVFVLAAFLLNFLVIRVNSYASRVVEIQEGQKVITTGPYALVRHPMYTSIILIMLATPIALGSTWGVLPNIPFIFLLAARAKNEEELLVDELTGYREYMQKTRYRLFPGIW